MFAPPGGGGARIGLILDIITAIVILVSFAFALIIFADIYARIGIGEKLIHHSSFLAAATALIIAASLLALLSIFRMIRGE